MSFNNNVPLANQTIAQTTDPIRNNFAFLQTNLQNEHSFNGNLVGVDEGVHKKVSMPNLVGAPALPTGTNGLIFVDGGNLKYYDGTNTSNLTEANVTLQSGYQWIGLILIQYGRVNSATPGSGGTTTFPIPFPTQCLQVHTTAYYGVSDTPNGAAGVGVLRNSGVEPTTTSFRWVFNSNSTKYTGFYWLAIGR